MEWANLVFVGLVIAQTFSANFQVVWAVVGVILFVGIYILSIQFMKGGM